MCVIASVNNMAVVFFMDLCMRFPQFLLSSHSSHGCLNSVFAIISLKFWDLRDLDSCTNISFDKDYRKF
jgi:hypothetical protein